jgi:hypothetical protein
VDLEASKNKTLLFAGSVNKKVRQPAFDLAFRRFYTV